MRPGFIFTMRDRNLNLCTKEVAEEEVEINKKILSRHWSSTYDLIDGFVVELIATFFICFLSIVHYCNSDEIPVNNFTVEFLPSFGWLIVLLTIRDSDGWFADASITITLAQYALGIYKQFDMPLARILGQLAGVALCIGVMKIPGMLGSLFWLTID